MRKLKLLLFSKSLIAGLGLLLTGFIYGILCFKLQLPPYAMLDTAYSQWKIHKEPEDRWQELKTTDITALLNLPDQLTLEQKHQQLIQLIWGQRNPFQQQAKVSPDPVIDNRYADIAGLKSIHKLQTIMPFAIESNAYWFTPKASNIKGCVLVHQGHGGDFIAAKPLIASLLNADYCVVAISMPLLGANNQPWVNLPTIGPLKLTQHDHLQYLAMPQGGLPIQLFIEPVVAIINFLQSQSITPIFMAGLSGGGWTTLLSAAVDQRIVTSILIAGDLPLAFRASSPRDWGDYEQMEPRLQSQINSLQLHALGATTGRKQVVIYNEFDDCCFAGRAGLIFIPPIQRQLQQLQQGKLHLYIDSSHNRHQISPEARQLILQELSMLPDQEQEQLQPIFFSSVYRPWRSFIPTWLNKVISQ